MEKQSVVSCQLSVAGNNFRVWKTSHFRITIFLLLAAHCLSLSAYAQPEEKFADTAPPPLKILTKVEKSQLESVTDIKQRTKLAIELMEARLVKAEGFSVKEEYPVMFTELGGFHALVDNTINFLSDKNNNSGKVLNNFKRIELSLRKYITRLELIRRDLPIKYELYVRRLVKYIREARSKAVETFFDDTVVPDKKPG